MIYEGPASGKPVNDSSLTDLTRPVSLGSFAPHEKKKLTVSLKLDEETDNPFQKAAGKVRWAFLAHGGAYAEYPYTGDDTPVFLLVLLVLTSLTVVWLLLVLIRSRREPR